MGAEPLRVTPANECSRGWWPCLPMPRSGRARQFDHRDVNDARSNRKPRNDRTHRLRQRRVYTMRPEQQLASLRAHWINGRNISVDGLEQPDAALDRRPISGVQSSQRVLAAVYKFSPVLIRRTWNGGAASTARSPTGARPPSGSAVSKPSINVRNIGCRTAWARSLCPCSAHRAARSTAVRNSTSAHLGDGSSQATG